MTTHLNPFRTRVVRSSLFTAANLGHAMERLCFVQADPIRSPARAQDLILRHRVKDYRAGDLERAYPKLELEECILYAYGFSQRDLWPILYPKSEKALTKVEAEALKAVKQFGPVSSKQLEQAIGGKTVKNYWGGFSREAKMAMESLHNRGALRIQRRENGIRIYEVAELFEQSLSNEERFKRVILSALTTMGPTTRRFILSELAHFKFLLTHLADRKQCLQELVDEGLVRVDQVDAVEYLSLAAVKAGRANLDAVRILAPFDPIVRDRARFKHLWNWDYRFEAYTPKAKRKLGYYAMPVLWKDWIIGWANASVEEGRLSVDFGYVHERPREDNFIEAAELEVARMATFLGLECDAYTFTA